MTAHVPVKDDFDGAAKLHTPWYRRRSPLVLLPAALLLVTALAVGLGVGLAHRGSARSFPGEALPPSPTTTGNSSTPTGTAPPFRPTVGTTWHIVLSHPIANTTPSVSVYDIDLFLNPTSTIAALHSLGRKVICYFSAGSYESFRPDASSFAKSDYRNALDGWPDERWLDVRLPSVRAAMRKRLDLARDKGCDGVDPDNVDGYDNDTGLTLTEADAVDYVGFLAAEAHARGLAVGLKNAGAIVERVVDRLEWVVNEECVQYGECPEFRPFVAAGKPVFHIEYPQGAPKASAAKKEELCTGQGTQGFSTVLKEMDLGDWFEAC